MELRGEHPALDRAERPIERLLDGSHGDLFEHDPGCVLGSVDVTHLWISRHDHRGRPIPAGEPRPLGDDDRTVPEIEDVLTEVPDGPVVGLRVSVERDLRDPSPEEALYCETATSTR